MVEKWPVAIPQLSGKMERNVYVYLPDQLGDDPDARFPVLYMFDGHNVFFDSDATYGKSWGMKDYMDETGTPLIIVAVECNHGRNYARLKEYSPFTFNDPKFGRIVGKGRRYMDWLVNTLKPMIDSRYPTLPEREATFIAGSSMGGLMSLYAALDYNGAFSRAACLSPSLWVHPRKSLRMIERARIAPDTCIYFDYGTQEMGNHPKNTEVLCAACSALLHKGVDLTFRLVPGGTHSEESWAQRVPVMMKCLGL